MSEISNEIRYDTCPNPSQMSAGVERYIEQGCDPGGFLFALICGDLYEAIARADTGNLYAIVAWWYWVRDEAPNACYGSRAKVETWIREGGLVGRRRSDEG